VVVLTFEQSKWELQFCVGLLIKTTAPKFKKKFGGKFSTGNFFIRLNSLHFCFQNTLIALALAFAFNSSLLMPNLMYSSLFVFVMGASYSPSLT
jgi:hypothetical protein